MKIETGFGFTIEQVEVDGILGKVKDYKINNQEENKWNYPNTN